MQNQSNENPNQLGERIAYSGSELDALLGISTVTRWRLEKRGLLRAVPGIRTKLYSRKAVEAFLDGKVVPS